MTAWKFSSGVVPTCVGPHEGGSDRLTARASRTTPMSTPAGEPALFETTREGSWRAIRATRSLHPPGMGPRGPRHPRLLPRTRGRPGRGVTHTRRHTNVKERGHVGARIPISSASLSYRIRLITYHFTHRRKIRKPRHHSRGSSVPASGRGSLHIRRRRKNYRTHPGALPAASPYTTRARVQGMREKH
jgi:hypothetical protein